MKEIHNWHNDTMGQKVVEAFEKNMFDSIYFKTAEEASKYIMDNVHPGDKVGFGGPMTIKKLAIQEKVKSLGAVVLDHGDPSLSADEKLETMRSELLSDLFLCSSNAITLDGELVNVDGVGNRVAAMSFGPKKVIVVVGVNKICKDEAAALQRIKQIAAPMNCKRLSMPNPCAQTGICVDCKLETRICRVYSVIKRKPMRTDITVVVIGEDLGF